MISPSVIRTERLHLIPATSDILTSDLNDKTRLSQFLDATVPELWPPEHLSEEVLREFIRIDAEQTDPYFTTWYWIRNEPGGGKRTLIGSGGVMSSPDAAKTVIIGYSVVDGYQGCGYATEAVGNLIAFIFEKTDIARILATTYPEIPASIRVLEKNGFFRIETSGDGEGIEEGTLCFARDR